MRSILGRGNSERRGFRIEVCLILGIAFSLSELGSDWKVLKRGLMGFDFRF